MILILYVNDLLLLGEDLSKIEEVKHQLGKLCARGSSLDSDSAGLDVASGKTQTVAMLSTTNG